MKGILTILIALLFGFIFTILLKSVPMEYVMNMTGAFLLGALEVGVLVMMYKSMDLKNKNT